MNNTNSNAMASLPSGYNEDGTITLEKNEIAYGVRDPKTKRIINSDEAIIPTDGKFEVIFGVEQNMYKSIEYILIAAVNNLQRPFKIDGSVYSSYIFSLTEQGKRDLNIEIDTNENEDKDITFIIYDNPRYADIIADDALYAVDFKHAFSIRRKLYQDDIELVADISQSTVAIPYDGRITDLFFTDNAEQLTILPSVESGKSMSVILSNPREYPVVYAVGSYLNWEQNPWDNMTYIQYVELPALSSKLLEVIVPEVKEKTSYQIFAAPYGISNNGNLYLDDYDNRVYSGLRTIITPKDE